MILPALLLTLDKYSSWGVGRVVPMIRCDFNKIQTCLLCRQTEEDPARVQ